LKITLINLDRDETQTVKVSLFADGHETSLDYPVADMMTDEIVINRLREGNYTFTIWGLNPDGKEIQKGVVGAIEIEGGHETEATTVLVDVVYELCTKDDRRCGSLFGYDYIEECSNGERWEAVQVCAAGLRCEGEPVCRILPETEEDGDEEDTATDGDIDLEQDHDVELEATNPRLAASEAQIDFGQHLLNEQPVIHSFVIRNEGDVALSVSPPHGFDATRLAATVSYADDVEIPPGAFQFVTLQWNPAQGDVDTEVKFSYSPMKEGDSDLVVGVTGAAVSPDQSFVGLVIALIADDQGGYIEQLVQGAQVTISDFETTATTDTSGQFRFTSIPVDDAHHWLKVDGSVAAGGPYSNHYERINFAEQQEIVVFLQKLDANTFPLDDEGGSYPIDGWENAGAEFLPQGGERSLVGLEAQNGRTTIALGRMDLRAIPLTYADEGVPLALMYILPFGLQLDPPARVIIPNEWELTSESIIRVWTLSESGNYSAEWVDSGVMVLDAPGQYWTNAEGMGIATSGIVVFSLQGSTNYTVNGRVTDPDGQPLPIPPKVMRFYPPPTLTRTTGLDGSYTLNVRTAPRVPLLLGAFADNLLDGTFVHDAIILGEETTVSFPDLVIGPQNYGTVAGIVRLGNGDPCTDCNVVASSSSGGASRFSECDDYGNFRIDYVPAGDVTVDAIQPGAGLSASLTQPLIDGGIAVFAITLPSQDMTPPYLVASLPGNNQVEVSTAVTMRAIFSEPMDLDTFIAANVSLKRGDESAAGVVSADGDRTLLFTPTDHLVPGWEYTFTLKTGLKDANGVALAAAIPIAFKTVAPFCSDNNPPCQLGYYDWGIHDCADLNTTAPCDDNVACTQADVCSGSECHGTPNDALCDDSKDCTTDTCMASGCTNTIQSGFCLISNSCYDDGATLATTGDGSCSSCNAISDNTHWTTLDSGEPCDDGNVATQNDQCQTGGTCQGEMADGDEEFETETDQEVDNELFCTGGVCTDLTTGLQWQQEPTGWAIEWNDAITHCQNLNLSGTGWRLPTISEWRTMIRGCPAVQTGGSCNVADGECLEWSCRDDSCGGCSEFNGPGQEGMYLPPELVEPCLNPPEQPDALCDYWSSTTALDYGTIAWLIHSGTGNVHYHYKASRLDVRCVRSCTPDCFGKECGDDGCGGSCGDCDASKACSFGRCVDSCPYSLSIQNWIQTCSYDFEEETVGQYPSDWTAGYEAASHPERNKIVGSPAFGGSQRALQVSGASSGCTAAEFDNSSCSVPSTGVFRLSAYLQASGSNESGTSCHVGEIILALDGSGGNACYGELGYGEMRSDALGGLSTDPIVPIYYNWWYKIDLIVDADQRYAWLYLDDVLTPGWGPLRSGVNPPYNLRIGSGSGIGWIDNVSFYNWAPCVPSCSGKECGDDGCGGTCGTCEDGLTCDANGQCICPSGTLCRAAANECDLPEYCNASDQCPTDAKKPDESACGTLDQCLAGDCVDCVSAAGCADLVDDGMECSEPACSTATHQCYHDLAAHQGETCTDDGKTCTQDLCNSSGVCAHDVLTAQTCLIAGICYDEGELLDSDGCVVCDPAASQTAWTNDDGAVCAISDDGNPCTDNVCQSGVCSYPNDNANICSDAYACTNTGCSDGNCVAIGTTAGCLISSACVSEGALQAATGNGSCQKCVHASNWQDWTVLSSGESCDDGNIVTTSDICTAGGVCAGQAQDFDHDVLSASDTCPTVWNPDNDATMCSAWSGTNYLAKRTITLSQGGAGSTWRRTQEPMEIPLANGILDDSIAGYWKLDGGQALDYSGNGNNGMVIGSPSNSFGAFEDELGAISFDGVDDAVCVPNNSTIQFGTGDFTVSFWMKASEIEKCDPVAHYGGHGWEFTMSSEGKMIFGGRDGSLTGGPLNDGFYRGDWSLTTFTANQWYFILGRKAAGNVELWVNGKFESSGGFGSGSISSTDHDLCFGIGYFEGTPSPFNGSIDDVLLLYRALSPDEIRAYYESNAPYGALTSPGAQADFDDIRVTEKSATISGATTEHLVPYEILGPRPHSDTPCPTEYNSTPINQIPHIADREDLCGVVAYWKLDGNLEDTASGGRDLQSSGQYTFEKERFGQALQAASFDGGYLYLDEDHAPNPGVGSLTVETWVYLYALPPGPVEANVISHDDGDGGYEIGILPDGTVRAWADPDTGSGGGGMVITDAPLSLKVWHHVAFVYEYLSVNSSHVRVYIDGLENPNSPASPSFSNVDVTSRLCLGADCQAAPGAELLQGKIDDVLIHSVAKSPEYIYRRANPGVPTVRFFASTEPNPSGSYPWLTYYLNWKNASAVQRLPILTALDGTTEHYGLLSPATGYAGWWRFNEGSGALAVDSSVNKNNGSLMVVGSGMPIWVSGTEGTALKYDASHGDVEIADSEELHVDDGSIELVFQPGNDINGVQPSDGMILSKEEPGWWNDYYVGIGTQAKLNFRIDALSNSTSYDIFSNGGTWSKDQFYPVQFLFGHAGMSMWVSYSKQAMIAENSGGISGAGLPLYIGSHRLSSQHFNGRIDSTRVMSRALEPDEFLHYPLASWSLGTLTEQDGTSPLDNDGDGVPDDGDGSFACGDNPCTAADAPAFLCDDNCPFAANPDQSDADGNGLGDLCDGWVRIDAGSFWMGSPEGCPGPAGYTGSCTAELGRSTNETLHHVTLTYDFEMMPYEVTQGEWFAAFGNNPSWFGPSADGADCGTNCPVERVDWYEALAYANELSMQAGLTPCYVLSGCTGTIGGGCAANMSTCESETYTCTSVTLNGVSKPQDCQGYRLPTESEWEYAARAGSTTAFYNGGITYTDCTPEDANLNAIGWYCGNTNNTHPAGGKAANAWGLYDLSGNVHEWAWDWYGTYPGTSTDPTGATSGPNRVLRGGHWSHYAQICRSAFRGNFSPGSRYASFGFRLVRTIGQ